MDIQNIENQRINHDQNKNRYIVCKVMAYLGGPNKIVADKTRQNTNGEIQTHISKMVAVVVNGIIEKRIALDDYKKCQNILCHFPDHLFCHADLSDHISHT